MKQVTFLVTLSLADAADADDYREVLADVENFDPNGEEVLDVHVADHFGRTDTYLDDPALKWVIEEGAQGITEDAALDSLRDALRTFKFEDAEAFGVTDEQAAAARAREEEQQDKTISMVFRGALGLMERKAGTPWECIETSLVWYFG